MTGGRPATAADDDDDAEGAKATTSARAAAVVALDRFIIVVELKWGLIAQQGVQYFLCFPHEFNCDELNSSVVQGLSYAQ